MEKLLALAVTPLWFCCVAGHAWTRAWIEAFDVLRGRRCICGTCGR